MDTGLAVVLASAIWGAVAVTLGLRALGRQASDIRLRTLEGETRDLRSINKGVGLTIEALGNELGSVKGVVERLQRRLDKLEQPPARKVTF